MVALAVGVFAGPARAQEAGERYREAARDVAEGKYDDALVAIDAGLKVDPDHRDLRRLRGEVLLQKRDFEGALAAYERFLEAKPRGANRRKARKIIRDLQAVKTTFVHIVAEPGPATVYIDSKTLGVFCTAEPECKKGMLPGTYDVFVERQGFAPFESELEVKLGGTAELTAKLVEKPSRLSLAVTPADAEVRVDGKAVPSGERTVELAPGDHVVEASLDGFAAAKQTVSAHRGAPVAVELTLAEKIPVKLSPAGAALELDGAPVTLEDGALVLPPGGEHQLIARADGYSEATATISATRTRGQPIELTLEKNEKKAPPKPSPALSGPVIKVVTVANGRKIGAGFLFGAAAVGAGIGAYYGLHASDRWQASKEFCDENVVCTSPRGFDLVNEAKDDARYSDIAFGVSAATAAVGVVLWLTAPSAEDARHEAEAAARPAVGLQSGPGDVGLALGGSF